MHPVVRQLVSLQKVDARVASVQKKIDAIPVETAQRRSKLGAHEKQRDELAQAIKNDEAEYESLEAKVQGLDAAIARQNQHRDEASNASAFTAAQHQIEYLSQDREELQNKQLELMDAIEARGPQLKELEARVEAERAEFEAYEVEAKALDAQLRAERDKIAIARVEFLADIPPQHLATYDDMFRTTGGQAVVPAEGGYCTGCYTRLTPNDLAYLATKTHIVQCKFCGRILFRGD